MKHLGIGMSVAIASVALMAAPASADSPVPNPAGAIDDASPSPGQTVTIFGDGWCPHSKQTVLFDREVLGHTNTDSTGSFSLDVAIPNDAEPGRHVDTLRGLASGCRAPTTVEIPATVVAAAAGGRVAGPSISVWMVAVAALLVLGAGALAVRRRRRGRHAGAMAGRRR